MLTRSGLGPIALAALLVASAPPELFIVDTEPGTFIDISESGIGLGISGDEETPITKPISNAALPDGEVWVGNNGALGFGDLPDTNLPAGNEPIGHRPPQKTGQSRQTGLRRRPSLAILICPLLPATASICTSYHGHEGAFLNGIGRQFTPR